ncbi:MFS transporter [Streptococcus gallolyticus]|uniref:MFS transporter n=1 Tax=Streptococcus hepaticus TaxID=3349163 RepID=UPI001C98CA6F|nr:MFS transporter [Streptococcus gallolyticus]MBY5041139.1 MFS transporter [Streptococcus gallolyticus]
MKSVLKNKLYLATFTADMISNFGDSLYYLALMNYVLLLPNPSLGISLVTSSESLPLLTRFLMGMLADKTEKKIQTILGTQLFRAVLYVIVGLSMGFTPALWIVIVAVVANLFADISGQYESYLFTPLSLRIVLDEDREGAMAFRQAAGSILQIGFQASGAMLIGLMTYQHLAFFNAGTFVICVLITLGIRPALNKLLQDNPLKITQQEEAAKGLVDNLRRSLKDTLTTIKNVPVLQSSVFVIMGINAVGSTLDILVLATIKDFSDFIFINPSATIATISIIFLVGNILGSLLCTSLFKHFEILPMLNMTLVLLVVFFTALFFHQFYVAVLVIFPAAFVLGGGNPKFAALMYRVIPEEKLATVGSGIDTVLTMGMVISKTVLSGLVLVLTAQQISLLYLLLSVGLLAYTIKNTAKS